MFLDDPLKFTAKKKKKTSETLEIKYPELTSFP